MVSSAEPLLLDLDLLAQDEWSPVVTSADASLEGLEARLAAVSEQIERFNAIVDQTQEPLGAIGTEGQAAAAGLDSYATSAESAAAGNDALLEALTNLDDRLAAAQAQTEELAASNSELAASNAELAAAMSESVAATEASTAALDANTAATDESAVAHDTAAASTGRHSAGLLSVETASMAGAAGLALFTAESVKMGASLEVADAKLVSFAGVGQQEIAGLNQQMLQLAANTGQAPKQVADGLYFAVSAGFAASDAMKVLTQSTQLATAAQTDSKTVTDVATSALRAYGLGADQTAHVLDVLTATTVAGKMEFADLAGSMGRLLPIASQAGVSLEQVGASIATMTQKGLSVEEATTAVRGMLLALEAPSKQTRDELAALGTTADEVRASIRDKGLLQTMSDLVDRTNGNMDALHNLIPNVRALVGVLADAGSGGKDYQAALDAVSNSQGKAAQAWENYEKTASASAERAKGQIVSAMTAMGLGIAQGVEPGLEKLNDFLSMLDKLGPGGHGGIATTMQTLLGSIPGVGPLFQASGSNSDQNWKDIDSLRDGLSSLGPLGQSAAAGIGFLEDKFRSGSSQSKAYADGVAKATADLQTLKNTGYDTGAMQEGALRSQLTNLQQQQSDTIAVLDQAKKEKKKEEAKDLQAELDQLTAEIDIKLKQVSKIDQERADKMARAPSEMAVQDATEPLPGYDALVAAKQPPALPTDFTAGFKNAAADIRNLFQSVADAQNSPAMQALKGLDLAAANATTDLAAAQTKLSNLLNFSAEKSGAQVALDQDAILLDSIDQKMTALNPKSAEYNALAAARADIVNKSVTPHQQEIKTLGDESNAIATIIDGWRNGTISYEAASKALDALAAHQVTLKGVTVDVAGATQQQIDQAKLLMQSTDQVRSAYDGLAKGVANAIAPWTQHKKATEDDATAAQTSAETTKTALASVGDARADLSGYQSDLASKADAAGSAARSAIQAQLQNITATASVNIQTTITQTTQTVGAAASGGANAGGAGNVMGLITPDGGSAPGTQADLVLDDMPLMSMMAFDASGGPGGLPLPHPTAPHISTTPPKQATAGGGAAKGARGGASTGTRSQAQGIAAAHSAMQADVQDIQKQLDDALAEFDALVHPDGKNALLARLTADLTNADSVSGLADAERVLFREALVQGGQAGANASADQLVNAWLQQASKGITDPAKLEELKAQAQRLLQALAESMPDVAATVTANKGIDLAAGLFSDLGSPDSVKTLTRQITALIESGRPDADEAVRHLLFGDGTPSAKQASDAAKVATAVRNLLIQNVDLNDPQSVARLQQQLADLQAALQAQATRQGLTIPVSLDAPDQNADAGIPGLIPIPTSSGGASPFSARAALGGLGGLTTGRGGWRPEDGTPAATAGTPESPAQAAARVIQQGQPKTDAAIEDELAKQVADAVLRGDEFGATQILMRAGSQEAIQRVVEKATKIIQESASTATQQVQALGELGQAKATSVAATPVVSTNTSAEDKAADQQAQAALDPGSSSNRVEQEAQTLAQLIEHGDPGSAQQYLSRIPKADFAQVVSRAREIIKADAEKNKTSANDLAAENRELNKAETAAAPTAATNLSPEEKAKLTAADEAKKKDPAYWSSKEAVAESDAITARRNADPGGDFGKNSANAGTVFLYAADAVMEQIRQGEQAYKKMMDQLAQQAHDLYVAQTRSNQRPIEVRVLATMNGRVVAEETSYHTAQAQEYADLGMPAGRTGG